MGVAMLRRHFIQSALFAAAATQLPTSPAQKLVIAARSQLGVTTSYDPSYIRLTYPSGDVPRNTGVCADVIVRAYRDALALDLQKLVHEDMSHDFSAYPHIPGMIRPDTNIDHRRVINLEAFWKRSHAQLWFASAPKPGDAFPTPLAAGDIVTWRLNASLPHVGIISSVETPSCGTQVLHNVGRGVEETPLIAFHDHRTAGHYRWALG